MDLLSLLPMGIVLLVVSIWEFIKFIFLPSIAILSVFFLYGIAMVLASIRDELREQRRINP